MNNKIKLSLASVGLAALLLLAQTNSALAATAPSLGTASSFAVLGASTVTNTGNSVISGDVGLSPGTSITGFPPGIVVPPGTIHAADAVALGAQNAATIAYNALASQAPDSDLTGQDLGGLTLTTGVYKFSSSAQLTGTLTLNAQGDPNAVFIFQIGSTLTTASSSSVVMINGGSPCNVFWKVGSSATLGTTTKFNGTIIADQSISLTNGASDIGRLLARNGAVTLINNNVVTSTCTGVTPGGVGLSKIFRPSTIGAGGISTLIITLTNTNAGDATLLSDFTDNLPSGLVIAGTPNVATTCSGSGTPTAGGSAVTLPTGRKIPGGSVAIPGYCTLSVDVTAASVGSYPNTMPINSLETSGGNNTVSPAAVILTVNTAEVGSISGMKFNDANNNGTNDGEQGLAGWKITLTNESGSVVTTTTDINGNYDFTGLPPGTYTVSETQQAGWTQTAPIPIPPGTYTVILNGQDVTGKDFGNFKMSSPPIPPVPELSTMVLMSAGIFGMFLIVVRNRR